MEHGHLYVCVVKGLGLQSSIAVNFIEKKRHGKELTLSVLWCGQNSEVMKE
jgi:hypothetical protein